MKLRNDNRDSNHITALLANRTTALSKFPFDPGRLYYELMPAESTEALRTLVACDMIRFQMANKIRASMVGHSGTIHFSFSVISDVNLPCMHAIISPSHQHFSALWEWATKRRQAMEEANLVEATWTRVSNCCNTVGQLLVMWPTMARVLYPSVTKPAPRTALLEQAVKKIQPITEDIQRSDEILASAILFGPQPVDKAFLGTWNN